MQDQPSKRQSQIGSIVQREMAQVFLREGKEIFGNRFITLTHVNITPDLLIARIYLSIMGAESESVLRSMNKANGFFRKHLGNRIRNKVRRIPNVEFFLDNTLDEVFKLDKIFKEIKEERNSRDTESTTED